MNLSEALKTLVELSPTTLVGTCIELMKADALQRIAYQLEKLSNIPIPIEKDWRGYGFLNLNIKEESHGNKTLDSDK